MSTPRIPSIAQPLPPLPSGLPSAFCFLPSGLPSAFCFLPSGLPSGLPSAFCFLPSARRLLSLFTFTCLALAAGCSRPSFAAPQAPDAQSSDTKVAIVKPGRNTVRHPIEQPGFNIEPFQETPLYAKIAGYVHKWNVDIGDPVTKDQVLAELDVPEMVVELQQKEAAIKHAEAQVGQAKAAVAVTRAQLERARSQYERLARVGREGILDRENVDEARLGYQSAQATLEKANADVAAAEAQLAVVTAGRDYARTMLQYAQVRAPYAGVVTQRNINTGDFIQPAASGARGQPLFVVHQIDPVRIFLNIPGADAGWIRDGDPVAIRLQGAGGQLFQGKVTRNARSLNPQARTLRTEVDLPNPQGKLMPGMYVQATILIQHPNVWTLPSNLILTEGDQTFCYRLENGQATHTPLQIGLTGAGLTEVLKKQVSPDPTAPWQDITGAEQILATDPTHVKDGQPVIPTSK